ncbi:CAD18 protein, partial [Jacana jacana]|nr:CAD18 protein [Jacana jacana]
LSSAGLSTGALIAILLCVVILLAIVVLFITLRRSKKEPLIISEEDVRENVVTYDDEGGGEEDTEAFDITALRNPSAAEELKYRRDVRPEVKPAPKHHPSSGLDSIDVQEFIKQRLAEADLDPSVPPYDSLQTYAYEGHRSEAGSISSLDSATTHSDQDYNYLGDWGPEFKKLAELYGEIESERT